MPPSFTDLTYFYEVATSLNFSYAAKKLGMSQPSLSMAINRLEKLLKVTLFIRHNQGVTLTQPGERLFQHVSELLEKWQKTKSSIQEMNHEVSGKVIIGCHSSLVSHLTEMVTALLKTYPALEIQILNDSSERITQGIIDGDLDIGIVFEPIKHPDLIMHKIRDIEVTYWTSFNTDFDSTIIFCDKEVNQFQFLIKELEKKQSIFRVCSVNNLNMVAELTASGSGIGILPACFVALEYQTTLKRLLEAPVFYGEIYLIYRGENRKMLAKETVLLAIKNIIRYTNS